MGKISKTPPLFLALIIGLPCVSLLMTNPVNAQKSTPNIDAPIPTPSIPEFTIKYVDHSYDVPTTTTSHTNPYTGEVTTVTRQGYHVKNFTIDIMIKNQDFPLSIDGNALGMRYFIQTKGHYEQDWKGVYPNIDTRSTSGYTTVSLPADSYPAGGKVDFRIMAWLGYYYPGISQGLASVPASFLYPRPSEWSPAQTVTIPASSVSPNPTAPTTSNSPAPSPTVPEFSWLVILPLLLFVFSVAVVLKHRKNDNSSNCQDNLSLAGCGFN